MHVFGSTPSQDPIITQRKGFETKAINSQGQTEWRRGKKKNPKLWKLENGWMNDDRLMSSEKVGSEASSGESQAAIQFALQNPKKQSNELPWVSLKMGKVMLKKRILITNLLQKQLDFQHLYTM